MSEGKKQTNDNYKFIIGILMIVIGVFFMFIQSDVIGWHNFWSRLIILLGLTFFTGYFVDRNNYGLLMPGAILTIVGFLFLFLSWTDWSLMRYFWPTFIIAPGIGFFLMYLAKDKPNKLYIPGIILSVIGLAFFLQFWELFAYWPYLLIGIGAYLILNFAAKKVAENEEKKRI